MKSNRDFQHLGREDEIRKNPKLNPIRKNGKEKHALYKSWDEEEDDGEEYLSLKKRESVYDYMDDEEEEDYDDEEDEEE